MSEYFTNETPEMITFTCGNANDVFVVPKAEYEANPDVYTPHLDTWANGREYKILTAEDIAKQEELARRPSRESMMATVGAIKYRKIFEGIYVEALGGWVPSTPNDALMYNTYATMAINNALPTEGQVWSLIDKTVVFITPEVALQIPVLAVQQQNTLFAYEQQLKEQIRTADEYWLIDVEAGWPETYYTQTNA